MKPCLEEESLNFLKHLVELRNMKVARFKNIDYLPASHEDKENPQVLKKVLLTHEDLILGRVQMVNWAKLPVGNKFRAHYHEDMEEIFIIMDGLVKVKVNAQEAELAKGDVVVIEPQEVHEMENTGSEDAYYIVIGITQGRNGKSINV